MKRRGTTTRNEGSRLRPLKSRRAHQSRSCESLLSQEAHTQADRSSSASCSKLELETKPNHSAAQEFKCGPLSSGGEKAQCFDIPVELESQEVLSGEERERHVWKMHEQFCSRRKIVLSGLPHDCNHESLDGILKEYSCTLVSKVKDCSARLLFPGPHEAKIGIALLNSTKFRGHKLNASFGHPDSLLFIGNLPYSFTSKNLMELFKPHGDILRCFIVYSTRTGLSKGYGFVEYARREEALIGKQEMANKVVGMRNLRVDFGDNGMQTCEDLQSKTLFVDKLPKGFTDDGALRECFGKYGTVNFCQVALTAHSGLSRGFAFVDMSTSDEAELAQVNCNSVVYDGQEIRVSFGMPCRPGACILQHKGNVPLPFNPANRMKTAPLKENLPYLQLPHPVLPNSYLRILPKEGGSSLPLTRLHPASTLSEKSTNHSHEPLQVPNTLSLQLPSVTMIHPPPPSFCIPPSHMPSLHPPPSHHHRGAPNKRTVSIEEEVPPTHRLAKKRPAPSDDDFLLDSGSVYDRAYIGQHQQGIPYTHPLKRIKMEI